MGEDRGPGQPNGQIKNMIVKRRKFLIAFAAFALLGATFLSQSDAATFIGDSTPAPAPVPQVAVAPPATCGTSAATPVAPLKGYGLQHCEDFDSLSLSDDWRLYRGGGENAVVGEGRRSEQCTLDNGKLVLSQSDNGATCGLALDYGQSYGYWEIKLRAFAVGTTGSVPHVTALLWPDSESPADGVLNFLEADIGSDSASAFLRCSGQASAACYDTKLTVDVAQWHTYGLEWTPAGIRGYIDGRQVYATSPKSGIPSKPMHLALQLDNLSGDLPAMASRVEADWVHVYAAR